MSHDWLNRQVKFSNRARTTLALAIAGTLAITCTAVSSPIVSARMVPSTGIIATSTSAFVRVNLAGYTAGGPKRAYLMSVDPQVSVVFRVLASSGAEVLSAPAGEDLGSWGSFHHVYPLDFDSVSAPGLYTLHTVEFEGTSASISPEFPIDTAANIYSGPLANSLYFYENERDGPNFIPTELRSAASHLNDETATVYKTPPMDSEGNFSGHLKSTGATIDASGGWWDAGDYLKFVETHSYVVSLMLIGVRDFPGQLGPGSAVSNFTSEARFGADWLAKMWDDQNRILYYQVGVGEANSRFLGDHDIWRLPQDDDTLGGSDRAGRYIRYRPVFRAGKPGSKISPNLAGRLASDFALCFQVFKATDPVFANQCLFSAEHIFDLADTAPSGGLLTAVPFDSYGETEWRDDLELGATELCLAIVGGGSSIPSGLPHSSADFYLQAAATWANAYIHGPEDGADTLNLYDVSGLAHFELFRALENAESPGSLAINQADLVADLKKQLEGAVNLAKVDPFGYGTDWAVSDSVTHGAGLSIMASEYGFITADNTYAVYATRWLDAILGANAWGTSFIVGDGSLFPQCMQHQVANLIGSLNGSPPVLKGALVEGPNSAGSTGLLDGMRTCPVDDNDSFAQFNGNGAVYIDNVQSFATVEPAIDLTAPSPLAFAWIVAGAPVATR